MLIEKQTCSKNYVRKKTDKKVLIEIKIVEGQNKIFQELKIVLKNIKIHKNRSLLRVFNHFQQYIAGKTPSMTPSTPYESALSPVLKKVILDFAFERFPKLLDLEIESIQKIDQQVEQLVSKLLSEVAKLKQKK